MKHRSTARLLSGLLVCAVSAFTQLQAASVSDLSFGLIDNGTAYAVTDIDANATGSLTVPSTYNSLPVTQIGEAAFYDTDISSIDLPDSITAIRNSAFQDSGITSIDLPASLTSLGSYAFYNCTSLSGTMTIPAGITVIPDYCFSGTAITEVVFEGEVTEIGEAAFYSTDITSIDLPDSLTSIGPAAFNDTDITSLDLPGSLTSIGSYAFRSCTSLSGTVTIPAGITVIPDYCFYDAAITEVVFEGKVTEIGGSAFSYNYVLERLVFRGSAPTVDSRAFYLMGRDVAGGTQIEVYESHRASFSGSPWTDYTFVEVTYPVLEAFALTSVFDPANSSLSIHSHGEPGSAGASVTVQHRASLSAGDNWTDVPAADVSVSTDSQTGAVVRSLNVDPSTQSEGFYRLQYNP